MIPRLWQCKVSLAIFAAKELPEERHHFFRGLRLRPDDLRRRYVYHRGQNRLENRSIAVPARTSIGVSQLQRSWRIVRGHLFVSHAQSNGAYKKTQSNNGRS